MISNIETKKYLGDEASLDTIDTVLSGLASNSSTRTAGRYRTSAFFPLNPLLQCHQSQTDRQARPAEYSFGKMAIIRIWSLWAAVAVSVLSTLLVLSTHAMSFETRTLEFLCGQPRGSANREICRAYISGVIDGIAFGRLRAGCLPQITDATAPDVVIDYLTKHSEKHFEKDASGVVYQALLESFQCKP